MERENMKRGIWTVLFLLIVLVSIASIGKLTGAITGGYPSGRFYPQRDSNPITTIEIIPSSIGSNGELIVEAGKVVYFTIDVGMKGIWEKVYLRGINGDNVDSITRISGTGYCAEKDRSLCTRGSVSFGDRKAFFKLRDNLRPGKYMVTACDGGIPLTSCQGKEIKSKEFTVVKSTKKS